MPLRILLATIGSSGDVNPVIGLGRGLLARGHEVTVATNEMFEGQVRACGLGFTALGTRAEAEAMMNDPRLWHPRKGFRCIMEGAVVPNIGRLYKIVEAHRGPGAVVAATSLCLGARVAQEKLGVPTATLHLQPAVIRSYFDNGVIGPFDMGPRMPMFAKRGIFWVLDTFFGDRLIRPELNAFRATLGLEPAKGIFGDYLHSPQLVLGLFPDWFAPRQPDWPPNTKLTGFILEDAGGAAEAHVEAERFLAEGPAPILVTPGSAAMDRTWFFANTVGACRKLGLRAMLVTNFPSQLPSHLPEGMKAFPYLPFSSVMPRCAAVVYHGGIGTLAQTIRAGVPHLIVANAHDQPDNGMRIERMGLGFGTNQRLCSRRYMTRTLAKLLDSPAIRARCKEMASKVDSSAAQARACDLIETLA
ncbi:MAG TPA: nucleotide disphospho-sugar-binding domain-containing protein [Opitutaceae bacterium]|jgi:rhamnosyltransferase subunit B|nr:nucleotide disphospho-sugar-binding domain-containing protein [Opitutaceae bacterium]